MDAAFSAVNQLLDLEVKLVEYAIGAVTGPGEFEVPGGLAERVPAEIELPGRPCLRRHEERREKENGRNRRAFRNGHAGGNLLRSGGR